MSEQLLKTKLRQDKWNQVFKKALTKVQKTLIGAKNFLHFNEVKCFRFLKAWCNQVWATFTNRTVSRQAKLSIHEKIQDHCSEPNDYCISMKQSVFALLKSGVTNCKQLLQTELRRDNWNEVLTKTLTKSRNHCSELNKCWIPMKQSVLAFLMCGETKSSQLL